MFKQEQFAWLADKRENITSQFGENGIIDAIFERIGTANKFCCECGAGNGLAFSNTWPLIARLNWHGLMIEADEAKFEQLAKACKNFSSIVTCFNYRVQSSGAFSFDRLLEKGKAPKDLDLLVIDVDSCDYWLFNSLVRFHPRVVMVEYDPSADKDFIPEPNGDGQAGLNAIINLGIGKYYWPVAITQTNVIFVQQELCNALAGEPDLQVFADGRWQDCTVGGAVECSTSKELADYKAGKLRTRIRPDAVIEPELIPGADSRTLSGINETPKTPLVVAVMSTPRVGFLATMDCIFAGLMPMGIPLLRGEGVFWGQTLERAFEKAIETGAKYVLAFDYDTVFEVKTGRNDVAILTCLMEDNPDVDCIVAAQMKREKGPLLATSDKEIVLLDPLVPIQQGHFGLTIFKTSALKKMPKPWFRDHPNEKGEWNENRIDADIHFWKQAVEAGLNVQMSLDVLIGHLELVVTWPGQNMQTVQQSISEWRDNGKPVEAFNRQRVIEAVRANPALIYGPKLEMGG